MALLDIGVASLEEVSLGVGFRVSNAQACFSFPVAYGSRCRNLKLLLQHHVYLHDAMLPAMMILD